MCFTYYRQFSMFADIHKVFADMLMSDIYLKGNYMKIVCSFFTSHGKQPENLQKNQEKIS